MQQPTSQGGGGTGDAYASRTPTKTSTQQSQAPSAEATTNELKADAKQLGSKAVSRLHSELDARKGTAADQARTFASALDRTAGDLDEGAPDWLKSTFRQGAEQIQRFAESIERKDSRQLLSDVESFARDRPGMFLASCAAVGFAAARIFRAGGEQQAGARRSYGPGTSYDEPAYGASVEKGHSSPATGGELV